MVHIINLLRNTLSLAATFVVVAIIAMSLAQLFIELTISKKKSKRYEMIAFAIGVVVAIVLSPFYYLPY